MRNQRTLVMVALVCIIFAATIFYYNNIKIPRIAKASEESIRKEIDVNSMPSCTVAVISDTKGISKYTEITEEILKGKIKLVNIPEKYATPGSIRDLSLLMGKITKEDLRFGEQVTLESLSADKKWYSGYQRLKEYVVYSIVADEVKSGNIIDIIVSYDNGDYDVVVPKIRVLKLMKSQESKPANEAAAAGSVGDKNELNKEGYVIILALDEEQYRDLELAKKLGRLETRLYLDESQPASPKTFNYGLSIKKLGADESLNSNTITDKAIQNGAEIKLAKQEG